MLGSPCQAEACKISLLPSVASEAFGAGPGEVGQIFSGLAALAIGGPLPATGDLSSAFFRGHISSLEPYKKGISQPH